VSEGPPSEEKKRKGGGKVLRSSSYNRRTQSKLKQIKGSEKKKSKGTSPKDFDRIKKGKIRERGLVLKGGGNAENHRGKSRRTRRPYSSRRVQSQENPEHCAPEGIRNFRGRPKSRGGERQKYRIICALIEEEKARPRGKGRPGGEEPGRA